ncbi:MAG: aldose epimerase family protein [Verrucomicrobiia bacterium]
MKIIQFALRMVMGIGMACLAGCSAMPGGASKSAKPESHGSITKQEFGHMPDGRPVEIYTLRNDHGMEVRILTYGGIIQSLKVPGRDGHMGDVVLGYDNLEDYLTNSPYFGALIGRYGNRIAKGRFTLDGVAYQLPVNSPPNSLHGGTRGFDKRLWTVKKAEVTPNGPRLELDYLSKDGEEGYPGNLKVKATYTLLARENVLHLVFHATTDRDTIINLTAHSYFNLTGHGTIDHDLLTIPADDFTPVDDALIPTGRLESVAGTPFDFRTPTAVGSRINEDNRQLKFAHGYDDNWVLNHPPGKLGLAARIFDPASGRGLEVFSDQPGVQFYTGNFLNGTMTGKGGWVYQFRDALTLEPQYYPDSPNHPNFPATELKPGQVYHNTIIYKFSVQP